MPAGRALRLIMLVLALSVAASVLHAALPPLIPRAVLFSQEERTDGRLSPDGSMISFLGRDAQGVVQLYLRRVGEDAEELLTPDNRRDIVMQQWAYDGAHLLFQRDDHAGKAQHLYIVDWRTHAVRDLTPIDGVRASLVALSPACPGEALVRMDKDGDGAAELYRLDLDSGALTLDATTPPGAVTMGVDARCVVRCVVVRRADDSREVLVRDAPGGQWKRARQWTAQELGAVVGFSADGGTLYLADNHDSNTQRLVGVELASGAVTVLAEDPNFDVGPPLLHPCTRAVQAASVRRERQEWRVLDKAIAEDVAALGKVSRGEFTVVSRDLADTRWLVEYVTDTGPTTTYLYERATRTATKLFVDRPLLQGQPLVPLESIAFPARDGLPIRGYLAVPQGVPSQKLPLVLLVHGGPASRDFWGYHAVTQLLANRGYAVLRVNFRGSLGFGRAFQAWGNEGWGGHMQDDLVDAVRWAANQGIADPARVAIMGQSYGGYAALAGVTRDPGLFVGGVAISGLSSLGHAPPEGAVVPWWPLHYADRVRVPVLLIHGDRDGRAAPEESAQMVEALRRAKKTVRYLHYTAEGHIFSHLPDILHANGMVEEFLAGLLGGRCEPPGEITGHSAVEG